MHLFDDVTAARGRRASNVQLEAARRRLGFSASRRWRRFVWEARCRRRSRDGERRNWIRRAAAWIVVLLRALQLRSIGDRPLDCCFRFPQPRLRGRQGARVVEATMGITVELAARCRTMCLLGGHVR